MALTVFYNTPSGIYSSTFFNQTIDIVEVPSFIDIQGLFLLLPLLGLLAGAGAAICRHMIRSTRMLAK